MSNPIVVTLELDQYFGEGTESITINFITQDGFAIDSEGGEIELVHLTPYELAYILDEIEAKKFIVSMEEED